MAGKGAKLPSFIASHLAGASVPPGASREFVNLIKAIGEAGTNHEEGRIIQREVKNLETKLREPNISKRQMREYLIRLMYCEMLGHEVSFGYIHAVKFTQHTSLLDKRAGYLAVSTLLHKDHELILLLVNAIQRDLQSSNVVEVCTALTAVCRLIGEEMIPAVLSHVEAKLGHPREIVRKKAVLCLHRFYQQSPHSIDHLRDRLRRALCDQDPGVMAASLNLFYDMSIVDPGQFKDLTPSFVSILKQIIDHRLPREFDYHKVPAPWIQIKLLKILALLGADDQSVSESIYEVLRDTMRRADIQSTVAYAIMYECVLTCAKIYPSTQLIEMAAGNVGRFLRSGNNNLKYLGITALAAIVSVNPVHAADYKTLVIDCLDDPDETLKRKTLDLLCKMTNPANVKVIVEKLVGYLKSTVDMYLRKDLTPRILQLADRFAPDHLWYLETMNSLFRTAGDLVSAKTANNLMQLIAEGDDDDEADEELRSYAASCYIDLLEVPNLPDVLIQTMAWVIGEYSYLATDYDQEVVLELMGELLDRTYASDSETKGWIVSGIAKLIAQTGLFPAVIRNRLNALAAASTSSVDLQTRCVQALALVQNGALMQSIYPTDASCEDLEVDPELNFLNGLVQMALSQGAAPYKPPEARPAPAPVPEPETSRLQSAFRFEAYETPSEPPPPSLTNQDEGLFAGIGATSGMGGGSSTHLASGAGSAQPSGANSPATARRLDGKKLNPAKPANELQVSGGPWSRGGFKLKKKAAEEEPTPAAAAAAPAAESNAGEADLLGTGSDAGFGATTTSEEAAAAPAPREPEPEPEPYVPPVRSEKAKLADELFAVGQESAGGAGRASKRQSRARKGRAYKNKTGGDDQGPDLLGDSSVAPPSSSADLLSLDLGMGSGTAASASSYTAPANTGGSLLDDFAGLGLSSSTDQAVPPPPSYDYAASLLAGGNTSGTNNTNGLGVGGGTDFDLLSPPQSAASAATSGGIDSLLDFGGPSTGGGDLLMPTQSSTTTASDGLGNTAAASSTSPFAGLGIGDTVSTGTGGTGADMSVPAELQGFAHEDHPTRLNGDATVAVLARKVWRPDALDVVLYVQNRTGTALTSVMTRVDPSGGLQRCDSNAHENRFSNRIGGNDVQRYILSFSTPTVKSGMALKGQCSYTEGGKTHNVHFTLGIKANDVLRPLTISTDRFGQLWQATSSQRALKLQSRQVSSVAALQQVCEASHFHCVQVIGTEVIFAAQVLNHEQQPCLLHTKLNAPVIEVQVHAHATPYAESVLKLLEDNLS